MIQSDPRLLNSTTPRWFDVSIRDSSLPDIDNFCQEVHDGTVSLPRQFIYTMTLFGIPFTWISHVAECYTANSATDSNKHSDVTERPDTEDYKLVYQCKRGPYRKFTHTHRLIPDPEDAA